MAASDYTRVSYEKLREFTSAIFQSFRVPRHDAKLAADALVHADLLGIDSHGVARLASHPDYVPGLRKGIVRPDARPKVIQETASAALFDGDWGLGGVVSTRAMGVAISKARETGVGAVTVTNSHHFGIAAHYSLLAVPHGMIGLSMTNAAPQVAPTYGRMALLGTNPLSVAAPTGGAHPFLLDMATSVVAAGKAEIAIRTGKPAPDGWLIDANGYPTTDPRAIFEGGALLPLGSEPERSSHKGYGLGLVVDILCGILSGVGYSSVLDPERRATGHFFLAMRIDAFRPFAEFVAMLDRMMSDLRSAEPAPGAPRILIPGDKEWAAEAERRAQGIPLHHVVVKSLRGLASECEVRAPF